MLKFFRKYNKIILGIGFAFLMVVFLLPQGVSQLVGDPRERTAYTYTGGRITEGDLIRAGQELQFMDSLYPAMRQQYLGIQSPLHWTLLKREAEAAGFVGGPEDGRNALDSLAAEFAIVELRQIFGQDVASMLSQQDVATQFIRASLEQARTNAINAGQTPESVDGIVSRIRGVFRLQSVYLGALTLSAPELSIAARDLQESVGVRYAPISAAALINDSTPEPTEEEILATFDKYKNTRRGEGEHGFGYLRAPAVRLEWMLVTRSDIERAVTLDPIEVNVHWQNNKDRFGDSFALAKPSVERELRNREVDRVAARVRESYKGAILQATGSLNTDAQGRYILPPDWGVRRESFESLALKIERDVLERTGVPVPRPDVLRDPFWLTRSDVAALPVIGQARIAVGRVPVTFADLVFSLERLGGAGATGVQAGVSFPDPLLADGGTMCFFRINEVRPESPPDSVDEVRALIVNDLKRLHEYESLVSRIDEIRSAVVEKGLQDATIPYRVSLIYPEVAVSRTVFAQQTNLSEDDLQRVRNAIMDAAAGLDPTVVTEELPMSDRLVIVPTPSTLSLTVAEIHNVTPLPYETFQQIVQQVQSFRRRSLQSEHRWPFSLESMMARLGVAAVSGRAESEDGETAG